MTKAEMLKVREDSYVEPQNPKCCMTCAHYVGKFCDGRGCCYAVLIRKTWQRKHVHPLGVCDLWTQRGEQE